MTDDLFTPLTPPNPAATRPKCRRHVWTVTDYMRSDSRVIEYVHQCVRCGVTRDDARAAMGKRNRSRGNAIERAVAKAVGGRRTGQFGGKDDVLADEMFAFQVKSRTTAAWPGWMARELDALRAARTDREPVLVVAEAPGPGRRARRLYVVDETTWLNLHGPDAPLRFTDEGTVIP